MESQEVVNFQTRVPGAELGFPTGVISTFNCRAIAPAPEFPASVQTHYPLWYVILARRYLKFLIHCKSTMDVPRLFFFHYFLSWCVMPMCVHGFACACACACEGQRSAPENHPQLYSSSLFTEARPSVKPGAQHLAGFASLLAGISAFLIGTLERPPHIKFPRFLSHFL